MFFAFVCACGRCDSGLRAPRRAGLRPVRRSGAYDVRWRAVGAERRRIDVGAVLRSRRVAVAACGRVVGAASGVRCRRDRRGAEQVRRVSAGHRDRMVAVGDPGGCRIGWRRSVGAGRGAGSVRRMLRGPLRLRGSGCGGCRNAENCARIRFFVLYLWFTREKRSQLWRSSIASITNITARRRNFPRRTVC